MPPTLHFVNGLGHISAEISAEIPAEIPEGGKRSVDHGG
jgi:hypothetical protein